MARNNQTFNASLRLNSKDFKKGVADVQRSLASLKSSFLSIAGALGAGLGFTQLISNLKDTAVQLSVAKNTLENVSKVTKEYSDGVHKGTIEINNYGENLAFVRGLAKDYSQDLVALMENFAQFHAACEKTNLDLDNQKLVFEALTKAAAFYHMSADRTKDMMIAITQMMSKGKVAAEELRRQLGNALPGAFNLMAAALGVSNSQLDDMMRKGQVLSAEALPKFAAMLNTVTKNADFDSLQMSLNRLKNTWYELVENSGAEDMFNGLVNRADKALIFVSRNISTIGDLIKGLVVAILSYKVFDSLQKRGTEYFKNLDAQLKKAEASYKKLINQLNAAATGSAMPTIRFDKSMGGGAVAKRMNNEQAKAIIQYNENLIKTAQIKQEIHGIKMMGDDELAKLISYTNKLKAAQTQTVTFGQKIKGVFNNFVFSLKGIAQQVEGIIMSMGTMAVVSAIIGGLTAIYSHVKKIREEWNEINNIYENYQKEVNATDTNIASQEKILRSNLAIVQDTAASERQRIGALKEINKLTGSSFGKDALDDTKQAYKDIVAEVERWVEATKLQAKIQVQARKSAEAEALIEERKANLAANTAKLNNFKWWDQQGREHQGPDPNSVSDWIEHRRLRREIDMDNAAIVQLQKVANDADAQLQALGVDLYDIELGGNDLGGGGGGSSKGIADVFEKYTKEKRELSAKIREHAISEEEYNKELDNLNQKYWENAAATGQMSIDKILAKMEKGQVLTAMEKWYKDLKEAAEAAARNTLVNDMVEDAMKEIDKYIEDQEKELAKALDDEAEKASKKLDIELDVAATVNPKAAKRKTNFDYKKSKSTIMGEELEIAQDHADEIKKLIDDINERYTELGEKSAIVDRHLAELSEELSVASREARTLEEAMNLQKTNEDIQEMRKSIAEATYGGVKDMASSLDRVVKGMESINELSEDDDATGWEKFIAVFNEVAQITDMIIGIMTTYNTIKELTNQLNNAEIAQQQQLNTLLATELALRQALAKAKGEEATATATNIALKGTEAAASHSAASAKAGEAVAGATASGAKLPFPYNLAAIAAGVAAVVVALASMSKFAKGGIVGGNSFSGDKQMARVNSGEMILNKAQQGNLYAMLNGKGGLGGNVEFKIRGSDLVGTLNNYGRLRK